MGKKEIGRFKCCSEGKDLTCYYCLSCKTIQHRSCIERKKTVAFLKNHFIYCSKKCEEYALEELNDTEKELVLTLRQIIMEQQAEIGEKSIALERERRKSVVFESEVDEAEKLYEKNIREEVEKAKLLKELLKQEKAQRAAQLKFIEGQNRKQEENFKKTIDELKIENEILKKKIQGEKEDQREKEKKHDEHLEKIHDSYSKEIEKLKEFQINNEKQHKEDRQETLSKIEEKYKGIIEENLKTIELLQSNIVEVEEILKVEKEKCLNLTKENQELREKINMKETTEKTINYQEAQKCTETKNASCKTQTKQPEERLSEKQEETSEMESKYKSMIAENRKTIETLQKNITDLKERQKNENERILDKEEKCRLEIIELKSKIRRIKVHNESLKETIKKLEQREKNIKEQRKASNLNETKTTEPAHIDLSTKETSNRKTHPQRVPQILFQGGKDNYNIWKIFKSIAGNTYDTICQYADTNFMEDILLTHQPLSGRLSKDDIKIVFTTSESMRRGRKTNYQDIEKLVNLSKNTNLLIVGAPFVANKPVLNKFVAEQNDFVSNIVGDKFVDCNKIVSKWDTNEDGALTNKGKWKILNYIYHNILQGLKNVSNKNTEKETTRTASQKMNQENVQKIDRATNTETTANNFLYSPTSRPFASKQPTTNPMER